MDDELEGMDDIGGEDEAPPPPKKKKSPIMFIGILVIAVIVAIVLVTQFIWPKFLKPKKEQEKIEKLEEKPEDDYKPGVTKSIEGLTMNVRDGARWRYFVCSVGLEVADNKGVEFLTLNDIKVRDRILYVLNTKRIEQLRDPQYTEDSLKVLIKNELNTELMPEEQKIMKVWIFNKIIQ